MSVKPYHRPSKHHVTSLAEYTRTVAIIIMLIAIVLIALI